MVESPLGFKTRALSVSVETGLEDSWLLLWSSGEIVDPNEDSDQQWGEEGKKVQDESVQ